jgi:hypothetical protein
MVGMNKTPWLDLCSALHLQQDHPGSEPQLCLAHEQGPQRWSTRLLELVVQDYQILGISAVWQGWQPVLHRREIHREPQGPRASSMAVHNGEPDSQSKPPTEGFLRSGLPQYFSPLPKPPYILDSSPRGSCGLPQAPPTQVPCLNTPSLPTG